LLGHPNFFKSTIQKDGTSWPHLRLKNLDVVDQNGFSPNFDLVDNKFEATNHGIREYYLYLPNNLTHDWRDFLISGKPHMSGPMTKLTFKSPCQPSAVTFQLFGPFELTKGDQLLEVLQSNLNISDSV